jgi:hypothetical protein
VIKELGEAAFDRCDGDHEIGDLGQFQRPAVVCDPKSTN